MTVETFYFLVRNSALDRTISVIDLAYAVDYEREDWITVDDKNFVCADHAIRYGRWKAAVEGVPYQDFISRYNSRLDENFKVTFED